jgi:hypothetical protein
MAGVVDCLCLVLVGFAWICFGLLLSTCSVCSCVFSKLFYFPF